MSKKPEHDPNSGIVPPAGWEVQFKTRQFCSAVVLYMLSEQVHTISLAFDPARDRVLWLFTKNGHKFQKEVRIHDVENSPDEFDELATRFSLSILAKIAGVPKAGSLIIPH